MFKSMLTLATAACMTLVLVTGAHAASCTQADMTKMEADMAKMTDATKKQGAMREMTMAREMMVKKDDAGCMMHMNNAMKMMPAM